MERALTSDQRWISDDEPTKVSTLGGSPVSGVVTTQGKPGLRTLEALARAYLAVGDHSGALVVSQLLLEDDPDNLEGRECELRCRTALEDSLVRRLGSLDRIPTVVLSESELRASSLDALSGFVVSRVDGVSSLEMVLDMTGMPMIDSLRLVLELVEKGVLSVE